MDRERKKDLQQQTTQAGLRSPSVRPSVNMWTRGDSSAFDFTTLIFHPLSLSPGGETLRDPSVTGYARASDKNPDAVGARCHGRMSLNRDVVAAAKNRAGHRKQSRRQKID